MEKDQNIGVQIFIIFVMILSVIIVGFLIYTSIHTINTTKQSNTGPNDLFPCSDNVSYSNLFQITKDTPICYNNGINTGNYYIGCNSDYNYVVSTNPILPQNVCNGYCDSPPVNGICNGSIYNGEDAQTNYDTCMQQLSGTNCIPPAPIATSGTILYYASSVTSNSCFPTIKC
jgi:hypothetical protein